MNALPQAEHTLPGQQVMHGARKSRLPWVLHHSIVLGSSTMAVMPMVAFANLLLKANCTALCLIHRSCVNIP
jgi:hypothetical protein